MEPEQGVFDQAAIQHYHKILDCLARCGGGLCEDAGRLCSERRGSCAVPQLLSLPLTRPPPAPAPRSKGLEPFLTLHHFVHPRWFEALGGFTKEENIAHFVAYTQAAYRCVWVCGVRGARL